MLASVVAVALVVVAALVAAHREPHPIVGADVVAAQREPHLCTYDQHAKEVAIF